MFAMKLNTFCLCLSILTGAWAQGDTGYEGLMTSAPEEFKNRCVKVSTQIPTWAHGDFIIPSIGKFEMGHQKFIGALDAFGKLQRFKLEGNQVCATYRMMATKFYNDSKKADAIAAGMLFYETDPPRHCPFWNPMCQLFGGNDNTFVNTAKLGKSMVSLTDSPILIEFDKESLGMKGKHSWTKNDLHLPMGEIAIGGTAHMLHHPTSGDVVAYESSHHVMDGKSSVRLYSISDDAAYTRKLLNTVQMDTMPYMHSFGLTEKYAVLPRQPVDFQGFQATMKNKPMHEAFPDLDLGNKPGPNNGFYIVPLDGGKPIIKYLPVDQRLYYTHTVNTYENEDEIIIDLTTMPVNAFSSPAVTMPYVLNKTQRDSSAGVGLIAVQRFHLPFAPDAEIRRETLSNPGAVTDFTAMNSAYKGKKHCYFWAVQWRTDPAVYGTMAIVKYNVCTGGDPLMWRRPNWFPAEPTFIPSENGSAEDAGLLLFTALDGDHNESRLMIIDAQTMKEVSAVGPFPRIGFTTHGEFYPDEKPTNTMVFL